MPPQKLSAENLANDAKSLSPEEIAKMARGVLASAMALNTVIQTLGEYLSEYHFTPHLLPTSFVQPNAYTNLKPHVGE